MGFFLVCGATHVETKFVLKKNKFWGQEFWCMLIIAFCGGPPYYDSWPVNVDWKENLTDRGWKSQRGETKGAPKVERPHVSRLQRHNDVKNDVAA